METAFLSLGSNRGDRQSLLEQATDLIRQRVGSVVCCSPLYETVPWGTFAKGEDLPFLNMALQLETLLSPKSLLTTLQQIEKELGRQRKTDGSQYYYSRPIDIDIILYGTTVLDTPELVLPHPRMHLRRFVLQPLCDIAPDALHPLFHKTVSQLLQECPE